MNKEEPTASAQQERPHPGSAAAATAGAAKRRRASSSSLSSSGSSSTHLSSTNGEAHRSDGKATGSDAGGTGPSASSRRRSRRQRRRTQRPSGQAGGSHQGTARPGSAPAGGSAEPEHADSPKKDSPRKQAASGRRRRRRNSSRAKHGAGPNARPNNRSQHANSGASVAASQAKHAGDTRGPDTRTPDVSQAPYVALSVCTSGIHPSTARIVSIDAITLDSEGNEVEQFHAICSSGADPGPYHLHGLTREEVANGKRFGQLLKPLNRLIDGRTLIVHNAPRAWGFIVSEARRAMAEAARANRSQLGSRKKRQRVGHIPRPERIVDTLASARRHGAQCADTRVRAVARHLGLQAPPAEASVERTKLTEAETSRETTLLIARMYFVLSAAQTIASASPGDLKADPFGLQRSVVRVNAMKLARPLINPGIYTPQRGLVEGMEVVVAPEIEMDPDVIIDAIVRAKLAYSEKLTRKTSVVVCNKREALVGKAMHGVRKGVPLLSDADFLQAVASVAPGTPSTE